MALSVGLTLFIRSPTPLEVGCWIGKSTTTILNMWIVTTPEIDLPSILRMRSGNNHVQQICHFEPEHQNLKLTTSPKLSTYKSDLVKIWGWIWDPQLHFVGGLQLPRSKSNIVDCRHLENHRYVITPPQNDPIRMKCGKPTQSHAGDG